MRDTVCPRLVTVAVAVACATGPAIAPDLAAAQDAPLASAPALASFPPGVRGRIVHRAVGKLGYRDTGRFCNRFGPCEPWCALFATWAWQQAGIGIGRLPFTGSVYDWAALNTYVLPRKATPKPGDAVLFGSGPASVRSSLHMGIVEDVYPGYLVTVEGDAAHRVLRMVVPIDHATKVGEAGPIYAYASPVRGHSPVVASARAAARPLTGSALRAAIAGQDFAAGAPTPTDLRLRTSIRSLRAFQHMPYRAPGLTIGWFGVNPLGKVEVAVESSGSLATAQAQWASFLMRFADAGQGYAVSYYTSG